MDHELLSEYVSALALGVDPRRAAPEATGHVEACEQCQVDLAELRALAEVSFDGAVPPAEGAPAPDLSFLPAPPARVWRVDEIGRLVVEFGEALLASLRPPSLAGATRGQLMLRYVQDSATTADLSVTIEVYAEDPDRTVGRVRVGVDLPGRDALDMSGSRVVLRAAGDEWCAETDETGGVDFTPVPLSLLPQLRVEITPPRSAD
ncbi:MAG TPA: hypothetical protein VNL77_16230 [Roseiflexaceae bacterium]|nr:hypothetical protein [Roseiflexaceae bacterium]